MNEENKTFADYLAILKRRHVVILLTFIAIFLPGIYITYSLDAVYRSTARFLVQQQSIPETFAQTTVTGYTDEQIQETRARVMSTTNIEQLIKRHGLYPELGPEDPTAVDMFRQNALFEPEVSEVVNDRTGRTMLATIAFDVSFDYSDPVIAHAVASDLAELYVRENEGNRLDQVHATIEFLEVDIERLKATVDRTASALADFRIRHAGNLPEQADLNSRIIERNERQVDQIEDEMRQSRDRKLALEGELLRLNPIATVYDDNGEPIRGTGDQLAALQRERLRLLSIYSPEHPDVVKINSQIEALTGDAPSTAYVADIREQLDRARAALQDATQRYSEDHPDVLQMRHSVDALERQLATAASEQRPYRAEMSTDPAVRKLQEQISAIDSDLRSFAAKRERLLDEIQSIEENMIRMPELDQEFAALKRANEAAISRYNDAIDKLDEARVAERLEARGSGDRIALVGTPRVPATPYEPNRTAILMLVIVLGAGAGIILATVIDTLDDTIKSTKDVQVAGDVPALAVIPYLETPADQRRRASRNFGLAALVVLTAATSVLIVVTSG